MNSLNITTIIAIYGAVISTLLFLFRYIERKELKRKLLIEVSSFVTRNENNNLIDGRRGHHHLQVSIRNKGKTATYIDRYFFKAYNIRLVPTPFCGFKLENETINSDKGFPFKLEHGEKFVITYPLTKSEGNARHENMEMLREIAKTCKYLEAYCCDTLEKWHHGKPLNVQSFCEHFDLVEKNLTE